MPLGFIGLGHMGSKMVANLQKDGYNLLIYDKNKTTLRQVGDAHSSGGVEVASSIEEIAEKCSTILSILPNDVIVDDVATTLLTKSKQENMLHISCSTISPTTSRDLAAKYNKKSKHFIASPVFARPGTHSYILLLHFLITFTYLSTTRWFGKKTSYLDDCWQ
jgi:3-hydroxyisobutyrate dehydrogenase-like beta-hydroxyacid dehydrogenase